MAKGILGKKIGMTQIFTESGSLIPVTVIEVTPNVVLQKKTVETDGYAAIQLGYADKKENSYSAKEQLRLTKDYLQAHCSQQIKMQNITSYKSELMQLNDFLQGAVCFYNRGLHKETTNVAKKAIIEAILSKSISLDTTFNDPKFNILIWRSAKK